MSLGDKEKKDRTDTYTAFAVLGLFLLFGLFITNAGLFASKEEPLAEWLEQPVAPVGFQGYPVPHDDESLQQMPALEEIQPLPKRMSISVASAEGTTLSETQSATNTKSTTAIQPVVIAPSQPSSVALTTDTIAVQAPPTTMLPTQVEAQEVEEPKMTEAKPLVEVKKESSTEVTVNKPGPKANPTQSAPVSQDVAGSEYITNKLPCVWVIGVFSNPGNVKRVVSRLRLNKFEVGTGAHEKGTYVGVPCACSGEESKAVQLREIFSAQPWLLRK